MNDYSKERNENVDWLVSRAERFYENNKSQMMENRLYEMMADLYNEYGPSKIVITADDVYKHHRFCIKREEDPALLEWRKYKEKQRKQVAKIMLDNHWRPKYEKQCNKSMSDS
jgi:hypothetical protein